MNEPAFPSVVPGMPDPDYRRAPGYGSTALKWFLNEVPAQVKHWIDHPEDAETFDAAAVGTLTHALVLGQPHGYMVKDWNLSTKVGKARAAEILAEWGGPVDATALDAAGFDREFARVGVNLIASADFKLAQAMAEGALRNPLVRQMLEKPGSAECSAFAEVDGVKVKARFDWLPDVSDERLVAVDFKTAASAHPATFGRSVAKLDYAVQRGAYLDVLNAALALEQEPELVFIAIDKRRPHLVSFVGLEPMWQEKGREKAARARNVIRECEERERAGDPDAWPDYGLGVHYLTAPTWYLIEDEEQEINV